MTCACSAEKRALDRMQSDLYETLREAAEVHRTVRKYAQSIIRPGIVLADMCEQIENLNRALVKEDGLNVSARALRVRRSRLCGVGTQRQLCFYVFLPSCLVNLSAWHCVPDGLLAKPRRRTLHTQRWRQNRPQLRRRDEGRLWHAD